MRDQIKKLVIAVGVIATMTATSAFAEVNTSTDKDDSMRQGSSTKKGDSEKKSKTENDDQGWKRTGDTSKGIKKTTVKSLSKQLERAKSTSIAKETPIVPIMLTPYQDAYPWMRTLKLDDILTQTTEDGTHTSYVEYLESLAKTNSPVASSYIDSAKVAGYMRTLQQIGFTIEQALPDTPPRVNFGFKDWQDIAEASFKNMPLAPAQYDVSGDCIFKGSITMIQCGKCVMDIVQRNGAPELKCGSGITILSEASAAGSSLKASVNKSISLKDSESLSQNDEAFKSLTHSLQEFVGHAAAEGHAVEATFTKEVLFEKMASGSKKVSSAIKAIEKKDNPHGVLSMLGISGAN